MTIMIEVPEDPRALRNAFACYPSGVTALCAIVEGSPDGMAASTFTTVSLDPPLVSVCIQNNSATWLRLKAAERIGVSVLGEGHDSTCYSLSSKTGDRFSGVAWWASDKGAILIEGATAHLDCSVHSTINAGDHVIVLLTIHALGTSPDIEPLVFHGSRIRKLSPLAS